MLRIHFTPADLTRVSVAPHADPLWEIVFSGFRLRERRCSVTYRPWLSALGTTPGSRIAPVRAGFAVLNVLAPTGPYFPDFLTPPAGRLGLEPGLDALARTPRRELRGQLERLASYATLPSWARPLADADAGALTWFTDTLRAYHRAAIAPFAQLAEQSVAADRSYRLHKLATEGVEGLWASMRPMMRWSPPVLEVDYSVDRDVYLNGRGLRLVPSYFCQHVPVGLADPDLPPVLVYPIAQQFAWDRVKPARGSLDKLVGTTRGAVLRAMGLGVTAGELARRTNTSAASISRHTSVLRNAGLARCDREGAAVLHSLTDLGRALVEADQG
ncbi:ArsR/SmtB family transcription factor [Actinophytocola xanthii]|uniref:HTH arsR-type domain-containing protein n=1 Tax=Actinophytocola xanthii TaxID=1912961 RepID=A0A1Q8C7N2_9PSEU|nr:winged helix-turn-helix transcriptional regulator [Actinophytocola xanthii]OLF10367.1 hypothetical protein BU204_31685 [Actinophytocola xanthii]